MGAQQREISRLSLEIGSVFSDGTFYAGDSPDTGEALIVLPEDAPVPLFWIDAMIYAAELDSHASTEWRLPTVKELDHLYHHKNKLPNFDRYSYSYDQEFKSKMYYWAFRDAALVPSWQEQFNKVASTNTSPLKISSLVQEWLRTNKNDWGTVYNAPSQRFDNGVQDPGYCMINRFSVRCVRTVPYHKFTF